MKKEIKRLGWLVVAAVLALTTVACSNDETVAKSESLNHAGKINMSVVVSKPANIESRALWLEGNVLKGEWKKGDVVQVVSAIMSDTFDPNNPDLDPSDYFEGLGAIGTLTAQSDGKTTTFTGTLDREPYGMLMLSYPQATTVYTGQKGTLEDIAANFDYIGGMIDEWSITNNTLTIPNTVELNTDNNRIVRFKLQDKDGNPINATSLTISDENNYLFQTKDEFASNVAYGPLTITPEAAMSEFWTTFDYDNATIDITLTATGSDGNTYEYSKEKVDFVYHKFYTVTVKMGDVVDLSKLTADYVAKDGDVLTGTLAGNYKVSIANGAKVTLRDVTINGVNSSSCKWAGITCEGDADIRLRGTNTVTGFDMRFPGIMINDGYTLTIRGAGTLTASPSGGVNGYAPGIGSVGAYVNGEEKKCGNINIIGGTINAVGGKDCPAIGGGQISGRHGWINIASTVKKVTATRGDYTYGDEAYNNTIGFSRIGFCKEIVIGGKYYWVYDPAKETYIYTNDGASYLSQNPLIYEP